ncbi:putative sulfate exporter family transporter [Lujinxingia litoralis]|uniref:Putative sulfate exporter family transporter n=1 Tax=Lujinxingia litoralis TaxID=2211119 RepID=A0A328CAN8_9DELT|nr:putative sulfate exporter family transporter [Lujinxingia litoralis]
MPLGAVLVLATGVSGATALFAGALLGILVGNPWLGVTRRLTKRFLAAAVVGLGAGMNLLEVAAAGLDGLGYTLLSIAGCLAAGFFLSRRLGVDDPTGILISVGTAICGGSAIAAAAPTVRANDEQVTVALATVFVLNGLALFIFPPLGHLVGLSQADFGLWSALAIHDTSSVVGASMNYGDEALKIATTTKLTRALWIVPVTFGLSALIARRNNAGDTPQPRAKRPWFILGFIAVAALVTYVPELRPLGNTVHGLATHLMVLTLFLVGAGLTRATLRGLSIKPLQLGVILWVLVASISLLVIAAPF